jgi:multiple sugar transport system permease protein
MARSVSVSHEYVEQVVRRRKSLRRVGNIGTGIFLVLFIFWTTMPFIIMIVSSFKASSDAFALPDLGHWGEAQQRFWSFKPTLQHYRTLFVTEGYLTYFKNSFLAAGGSAIVSLVFGASAAYALSRSNFRRKGDVYFWVLTTRMAPVIAVLVPLYTLFKIFGLLSSIPGLIVAYTTFNLPFSIWILKGFFDNIPYSIEEAYMVDGLGRVRAFLRTVPLAAPGLVAVFVLCVLLAWNDFLFAAIMGGNAARTLPVATAALKSSTEIRWGEITAAGVLTTAPMMLLGLLIRKYLITGLTMGAVRE